MEKLRRFGFNDGDTVTKDLLNKRYRELAKKHHPDRGGNPDTFKELVAVFDELKQLQYPVIVKRRSPYTPSPKNIFQVHYHKEVTFGN